MIKGTWRSVLGGLAACIRGWGGQLYGRAQPGQFAIYLGHPPTLVDHATTKTDLRGSKTLKQSCPTRDGRRLLLGN